MLGLSRRRKQRQQRQVVESLAEIDEAILRRVLLIIHERGIESPKHLPRLVVNKLLGKTAINNGDETGVAKQIAGALAAQDDEARDAVFISLQARLAVEGANKNFDAERRILETIQWLKEFGEIPQTSHDAETLKACSEKLRTNLDSVAA